jgi:hypothetical protein
MEDAVAACGRDEGGFGPMITRHCPRSAHHRLPGLYHARQ